MSELITNQMRLVLTSKALLKYDRTRRTTVLLLPERVVKLNASSAAILELCDGALSMEEIIRELERRFGHPGIAGDVVAFLNEAIGKGWVEAQNGGK